MNPKAVRRPEQIKLIKECWLPKRSFRLSVVQDTKYQSSHLPLPVSEAAAAEIQCGNITLRLLNGAGMAVVRNTLKYLGYVKCLVILLLQLRSTSLRSVQI